MEVDPWDRDHVFFGVPTEEIINDITNAVVDIGGFPAPASRWHSLRAATLPRYILDAEEPGPCMTRSAVTSRPLTHQGERVWSNDEMRVGEKSSTRRC